MPVETLMIQPYEDLIVKYERTIQAFVNAQWRLLRKRVTNEFAAEVVMLDNAIIQARTSIRYTSLTAR